MAKYTVNEVLAALRNGKGTFRGLLKDAGISLDSLANTPAGDMLRSLCEPGKDRPLGASLQDIFGSPDASINPEDSEQINAYRKRIVSAAMDKDRPIELTTAELLSRCNAKDDHDLANLRFVIDLMQTPPSEKVAGIKGLGDFEHYEGKARGATYIVVPAAAERFDFKYSEEIIYKVREDKTPGRRGRKKIVAPSLTCST